MLAFSLQHEIIVLIMFLALLASVEIAWALYLNRAYANPPEPEDEEVIEAGGEEGDTDE
jgi:hypothetical protein